ncbi:MAG: hypothetical protein ABSB70_22835 [Candidatus Velthaea sp.]|jgi:hypothetical protein
MDDTAFLHERIESYAGYTNDIDRQRSDEQIRAYVGEALTRLRERLHPQAAAGEALERLLVRCEFADQGVAHAFDAVNVGADEIAATAAADRELVRLADRANDVDAAQAGSLFAQIAAAFDRRWQTAGAPP